MHIVTLPVHIGAYSAYGDYGVRQACDEFFFSCFRVFFVSLFLCVIIFIVALLFKSCEMLLKKKTRHRPGGHHSHHMHYMRLYAPVARLYAPVA